MIQLNAAYRNDILFLSEEASNQFYKQLTKPDAELVSKVNNIVTNLQTNTEITIRKGYAEIEIPEP